jgi:hypothetical protein
LCLASVWDLSLWNWQWKMSSENSNKPSHLIEHLLYRRILAVGIAFVVLAVVCVNTGIILARIKDIMGISGQYYNITVIVFGSILGIGMTKTLTAMLPLIRRPLPAHSPKLHKNLAIAEIFAAKRERSTRLSSALVIAMITYSWITEAKTGYYLGVIILVLLWSDHLILAYRIRRGYYATNQHEAKELLRFLIAHADKGDFSDGDDLRRIFPTPEEVGSEHGVRLPGYAEA